MLWRTTHEFLRWLWPAIFAGLLGFIGLVIAAASIWREAKDFGRSAAIWIASMLNTPWPYVITIVLFLAWLAAFIWSGQKLAQIEAMRDHGPFTPDKDGFIILDGGSARDTAER